MRARVPALCASLAVASLVLTACGSHSTASADGPAPAMPSVSLSPSSSAAATSSAAASPSGSASAAPTSAARTSSRAATTKAAAPTTGAPAPVAGQKVPTGYTPTGTFTFDQTGSFSNGDSPQPTSTLAADAPQGTQQHTHAGDSDGSTDTTLDHRADGLHLVRLSTSGPDGAITFQPADTPVFFPLPTAAGQTWSFTTKSTDGKYTLVADFKAGARTTTTIGGKAVPTTPVHATLTVTATGISVVETLDSQVDTDLALQVTTHDVTKGKAFGFTFDADVTQTLRSLTPA